MSELNFAPEGLSLPQTADACRTRLVSLQAEVASIRLQIATTDIRRQTEKKALDASAFHRAKTALRLKQYELGLVSAHLAKLAQGEPRGAFKDTLIELVREQFDDNQWTQLVSRAKAAHHLSGEQHGCSLHLFVPDLVPARQVDAGEDWVEYLLPSGERWRDQGFVKRMENVSCL